MVFFKLSSQQVTKLSIFKKNNYSLSVRTCKTWFSYFCASLTSRYDDFYNDQCKSNILDVSTMFKYNALVNIYLRRDYPNKKSVAFLLRFGVYSKCTHTI